jgi:hypothetical protein
LAFQNFCDFARRLVRLFAPVAKLVKGGKRLCLIVVHETQQEIVGIFRDEPKRRESGSPGIRASRRRCNPALYQFS